MIPGIIKNEDCMEHIVMTYSIDGLTKKQALDFMQKALHELTAKELDNLFAYHINRFHFASTLFRKVKKAVDSPMRVG